MNPNENMQFRDNRDFWFSHLDIQVMQYKGLSFYAKAIYALLTTYVDIRTRSWSVKAKTLAETAGISERQVRYALKELKDMGIITSEAVYKDGQATTRSASAKPVCRRCRLKTHQTAHHAGVGLHSVQTVYENQYYERQIPL